MQTNSNTLTVAVLGVLAAILGFFSTAGAEGPRATEYQGQTATAVFAGGCFWCVEADFDKVDGVISTVSGYTGGNVNNPTYKQVTYGNTGHYEAVEVTYDPSVVSYEELVAYFFRHIDPTDPDGQFCDTGESYRTAVFAANPEERAAVEAEIAEIEASGVLDAEPVVTKVRLLGQFWPAEDYHQDFYKKSPGRYQSYRTACGRDRALERLWGETPES